MYFVAVVIFFLHLLSDLHPVNALTCQNGGTFLTDRCFCENSTCQNKGILNDTDCSCKCVNSCFGGGTLQTDCQCECFRVCDNNGIIRENNCTCDCNNIKECLNGGILNQYDCSCNCINECNGEITSLCECIEQSWQCGGINYDDPLVCGNGTINSCTQEGECICYSPYVLSENQTTCIIKTSIWSNYYIIPIIIVPILVVNLSAVVIVLCLTVIFHETKRKKTTFPEEEEVRKSTIDIDQSGVIKPEIDLKENENENVNNTNSVSSSSRLKSSDSLTKVTFFDNQNKVDNHEDLLNKSLEEISNEDILIKNTVILTEIIGEGAFGVVHGGIMKINDIEIDVAVKRVNISTDLQKENFMREVKMSYLASKKGNTRNIIKCFGCFFKDNYGHMVMEKSLMNLKKFVVNMMKSNLNIKDIVFLINILLGVAEGVNELHSLGIIHRDLKLENILIDGDEFIPKVCDLGSGKKLEQANYSVVGSVHNIPPEIVHRNVNGDYDQKLVDVYGFAFVMYECFAYQEMNNFVKAVAKGNQFEALIIIADQNLRPSLESLESFLPNSFLKLIVNCWCEVENRTKNFFTIIKELNKVKDEIMGNACRGLGKQESNELMSISKTTYS